MRPGFIKDLGLNLLGRFVQVIPATGSIGKDNPKEQGRRAAPVVTQVIPDANHIRSKRLLRARHSLLNLLLVHKSVHYPCHDLIMTANRMTGPGVKLTHTLPNVHSSPRPPKYFLTASSNTRASFATAPNNVIDDRNFIASTGPKMPSIARPSTRFTSSVHSTSLGPSTACARYASASSRDPIPNFSAIQLRP